MKDILIQQINLSIARANWWTAYANTPANLNRIVHHGGHDGPLFTKDELIDDAMRIANNHLSNAQEMLEKLNIIEN
jgi:hypothetical protein